MLTTHEALVYSMVITAAADHEMTDAELITMGEIVNWLPVFRGFDTSELARISGDCAKVLLEDDGFEKAIELVHEALPERLRETAYALAVEVAAADLYADQAELSVLQMLRYQLEIDRLIAAGIERGARARFSVL